MKRRAMIVALVPAVALAAPKRKTKTTTPSHPVEAGSGSETRPDTGSGSATPAATPTPPPAASTAPATPAPPAPGAGSASAATESPTPTNEPDVDALRQEYLSLRDELFKSRARANAVASALYSTRVQIRFTWTTGRYYGVSKASIRLDGTQVFEDTTGAIAGDDGVRFDGYVAPGRHLVTFHVEASGKDDDSFTSSTESQVVVKAVANKDLMVAAKGRDAGNIAYEWKRSENGNYGLGIDVSVKTQAHAEAGKK